MHLFEGVHSLSLSLSRLTCSERSQLPVASCPMERPSWQGTDISSQQLAKDLRPANSHMSELNTDPPLVSLQDNGSPSQHFSYSL